MTKTISDIEKCAKLMGYEGEMFMSGGGFLIASKTVETGGIFNPLTNKSDLMDLECALPSSCIIMNLKMCIVTVDKDDGSGDEWEADEYFKDHPDKFTARAHAVIAVAVQIYDRTNP